MYGGDTKNEKTVFLHLVWGDRRRYRGVGRKSLVKQTQLTLHITRDQLNSIINESFNTYSWKL